MSAGPSTVAANELDTLSPPGSVAATRIVAAPSPAPVNVTTAPAACARTRHGADEDAVYVSTSPSGSANACDTSTCSTAPTDSSLRAGSVPTATGGRLAASAGRSRQAATAGPMASRTAAASEAPVNPDPVP